MTGLVTVVGSINVDVSMSCASLPRPGETVFASAVVRSPGGKGANQAVAASRAGGALTAMVGAVGEDADGEAMRRSLEGAGVRTEGVAVVAGSATGLALITVDDTGENTIVVAPGANAAVRLDASMRAAVAAADVILAPLENPQPFVAEAVRERRQGAMFILNAAPAAQLDPDLLREVDVLVVNQIEACSVAGEADLDAALTVLLQRVPAVLVTLGAAGSLLRRRDGDDVRTPSPRVVARDTTAAGDTYCGVLAAALAGGLPVEEGMVLASAAASLTVEQPGAQESVPTAEQTQARVAAVREATVADG